MVEVTQRSADDNTVVIDGVSIIVSDNEPRIRDTDLAERLEFGQPRDIRKLVKRMVDEGEIADVPTRATVARVARTGRGEVNIEGTEYLLDEEQALLVAIRSDAPKAKEVRRMLVRVFMLARRGQLNVPPALPSEAEHWAERDARRAANREAWRLAQNAERQRRYRERQREHMLVRERGPRDLAAMMTRLVAECEMSSDPRIQELGFGLAGIVRTMNRVADGDVEGLHTSFRVARFKGGAFFSASISETESDKIVAK